MITYYIVRDVSPDANCSYKRGRTLLNLSPNFIEAKDAESLAEIYNTHHNVSGVHYSVVGHDEDLPFFLADHFEN